MNINKLISQHLPIRLSPNESKIPWNDADFSQRMLENHLSQEHDWASRKLAVIERQVDWLCSQLAPGAKVLDLGCGPGFYTQLLAKRGFCCTGVDFSPASIAYAQQQAQAAGLDIDYQLLDVRSYRPTKKFDFIMMTFGELNVFSTADAKSLLKHCANWLMPNGKLLVEVHSFDEVKRQGQAEPSWQRHSQGLFLDAPHLLLTEHAWDEALQTSSTLFWVIEENGKVARFGSRMQAWQDEEYLQLLNECGFNKIQRIDTAEWPSSNTFEGKLYTLMACSKA
ncbi:class I SAM-dependent methyltransferase [Shewanella algae]|uniref:class I SAM-dependent methyltransferase n=1 Tax=Shewanella algae TaxID=38313 RepID=UPI000BB5FF5F|nr:class I SAM-dependent methyltransferase [Shewanella algae]MBO2567742.1 methyltransferase domain-containing protein [Shewanella algae]MBO2648065.1 methyltransferase domain-containing protein [Shewanella algae]PBQ25588.1 SAM-dependent methyltransferase [Shewanella algae]QNH97464.1 methyltransferase domain-containing protein [Shewanella algae]TVO81662.1 SAM-dependent methyltransferase [Shewanella algae]